jgi:hypothetical protein
MAKHVKTEIDIKHKDRNRTTVFWRGILAFPVIIFVATFAQSSFSESENWAAGTAGLIVLANYFGAAFSRKIPKLCFNFQSRSNRTFNSISSLLLILNDKYPSIESSSKVSVVFPDVDGGKKLNRWLPLVKWILAIPHYIVGIVYLLISLFVTVIAWVQTSITGKYPRWAGEIVFGTIAYWNRVQGYMLLLVTDKYPTFNLK